ncbi:hypothetical protein, partial [Vibrio anguillarum]|uniref:hypothetical protein n=1 Tax=Vibrio anguillarum TaxID=55601 RepID=UPI001BE4C9C2
MELQFIFDETNYNALPCRSKSHHERSTDPSKMRLAIVNSRSIIIKTLFFSFILIMLAVIFIKENKN